MKKLKSLLLASLCFAAMIFIPKEALASAKYHTVQQGDTLWNISKRYGVPLLQLKKVNNKAGDVVFVGEILRIPEAILPAERELLARLVHAEAKGEPYAGKVAVATVVLNRVDHASFPNTIKGVIYQRSSGHYAFTPVQTGSINQAANSEAYRAVDEALAFRGLGSGSLYFYNPKTAKSNWIRSKQVTVVIGNHVFAK